MFSKDLPNQSLSRLVYNFQNLIRYIYSISGVEYGLTRVSEHTGLDVK